MDGSSAQAVAVTTLLSLTAITLWPW